MYPETLRKGLFGHVWVMEGGRCLSEEVADGGRLGGPGFWGYFQLILTVPGRILIRFWSHFQGFGLEPLGNLGTGSNEWQKWIQHPQNRRMACCQPLGPTFLDRNASRGGSQGRCLHLSAWVHMAPRHARIPTFRGTPAGGRRVNKSRSQGLTTGYPPILMALNPFMALI